MTARALLVDLRWWIATHPDHRAIEHARSLAEAIEIDALADPVEFPNVLDLKMNRTDGW